MICYFLNLKNICLLLMMTLIILSTNQYKSSVHEQFLIHSGNSNRFSTFTIRSRLSTWWSSNIRMDIIWKILLYFDRLVWIQTKAKSQTLLGSHQNPNRNSFTFCCWLCESKWWDLYQVNLKLLHVSGDNNVLKRILCFIPL